MSQPFRAPKGGLIDRRTPAQFSFDGVPYQGYAGDSLASALLANGVRVVGRSFKYHRRRGIVGAGNEEPNALVSIGEDSRHEPNLRATQIELFNGLVARSQNRWPSLSFDVGAINNVLSRFLPAGFYYKTFMWPKSWWMRYEHIIRSAAGLGHAARQADPDIYFKRHAHCDVLVVGAGPAGLMAALTAARAGKRVMLVDEGSQPGGQLLGEKQTVDGDPGHLWARDMVAELGAMPGVRVLQRSTAFGYYDDNLVAVCEQVTDHAADPQAFMPRQRIWWVRAGCVVLATGAMERPLVFPGNDLPGVMLASAAGTYAHRYAVRAGRRSVLFANNDQAYRNLDAMTRAGVDVRAVVDPRPGGAGAPARRSATAAGAEIINGAVVSAARGRQGVDAVSISAFEGGRVARTQRLVDCDLLCMSGGWNPTVHLFSQAQGRLRYDNDCAAFLPDESPQAVLCCGAVVGAWQLADCLADGVRAGGEALKRLGVASSDLRVPTVAEQEAETPMMVLWEVPRRDDVRAKSFVDFQNDVTSADVRLASRENYQSVEHLKRYTTLGMGTDQGRTSNVNGLAILAATLGREIPQVGTTTFRPPYSPVTLGALCGMEVGDDYAPLRRTPLHEWHLEAGGVMQNVGAWQRARYYPRAGESMADAVARETRHVREAVGLVDVSTFGKIDIRGADAAEFLERVTINRFHNLRKGRCRYHVMLREDGFVMDDGTTTRVEDKAFYMTTTTAAAGPVMAHLEYYAQTVWPELDVHLTSISDQWGGLALAGPRAREALAACVHDVDVSNEGLPFMGSITATIDDAPVRIFRITFSGELGYEMHMPAGHTLTVWNAVLEHARTFGVETYGTEAMAVMRIEKGHVVHAELDGRTLASDFGFDRMMRKDGDFVGRRALEREAFHPSRRPGFVGLRSENGQSVPAGAQLVWNPTAPAPMHKFGHVTSVTYSPTLDEYIALALVEDADRWRGEVLYATSPLARRSVPVRVVDPVFVDPEGKRARG